MRQALAALALFLVAAGTALAGASLSNVTIMTWDPGHGTQVEYYDAKGSTYLWYPGNRRIVRGKWKTEGSNICFAYQGSSYNPVTGHSGGGFECMPASLHEQGVVDRAKGDVFGLSKSRTAPFILARERTTIEALRDER